MNATCGLGISCGFRISGLLSMEECKNQSDPSAWRRDNSRGVAAHAPGLGQGTAAQCHQHDDGWRQAQCLQTPSTAGWSRTVPHSRTARHSSTRCACAGPVSPSSTSGSAVAVAKTKAIAAATAPFPADRSDQTDHVLELVAQHCLVRPLILPKRAGIKWAAGSDRGQAAGYRSARPRTRGPSTRRAGPRCASESSADYRRSDRYAGRGTRPVPRRAVAAGDADGHTAVAGTDSQVTQESAAMQPTQTGQHQHRFFRGRAICSAQPGRKDSRCSPAPLPKRSGLGAAGSLPDASSGCRAGSQSTNQVAERGPSAGRFAGSLGASIASGPASSMRSPRRAAAGIADLQLNLAGSACEQPIGAAAPQLQAPQIPRRRHQVQQRHHHAQRPGASAD